MGGKAETMFELMNTCSNTMVNYQYNQKLKLLQMVEVNHLTVILTPSNVDEPMLCMEFSLCHCVLW